MSGKTPSPISVPRCQRAGRGAKARPRAIRSGRRRQKAARAAASQPVMADGGQGRLPGEPHATAGAGASAFCPAPRKGALPHWLRPLDRLLRRVDNQSLGLFWADADGAHHAERPCRQLFNAP